jgi:acyl carrier protein
MPDHITERVIQVIVKTQHMETDTVKAESTFEDLKIDSLDGLQILFALEEEFNVNIPDESAKQLRSVADIAEGIRTLLAQQSAPAGA